MARAEHDVLAVHPRWRIVGGELAGRICDVGEPGGRFLLLAVDRDIAEALVEHREESTGLVLRLAAALSVADPEGLAAILADSVPAKRMAVTDARPTGEPQAAFVYVSEKLTEARPAPARDPQPPRRRGKGKR